MSVIVRAAFRSARRAPSLGVNLLCFPARSGTSAADGYWRCKTLTSLSAPLRRDYSVRSNAKPKEKAASNYDTDDEDDFVDEKEQERPQSYRNADGNEVIYTGFLNKNVRNIKIFSLSTSFIGLAAQPIIFAKLIADHSNNEAVLPVFAFVGCLAVGSPLLLHYVTKRYVLNVEYDEKNDKYLATVYSLFARKKKIEFTPDDVTIPTVLGMFTTCAIKGKPMFLDANCFTDQNHYVRIMGYDKPVDLKLGLHDDDESTKKRND